MSERLDLIKSLIVPAKIIADVGCDHGRIAEYCANSGVAELVIASDISGKCLQKARTLLGDKSNVKFV
ncbi:MAG: class I SAM-dependent methyltransferase, partial [Clostridiales bacterium]|nr:class I SAM-dependent methyltransferase [Clostridiales bacterium]